jgi:dienelactone hydrolase
MFRVRLMLSVSLFLGLTARLPADPLPETKALTLDGDLAARMVAGIDKYLMRELAASVEKRQGHWKPDYASPEAYARSVQPNRDRLKKVFGVVDARPPFAELEYVGGTVTPALVAETEQYRVHAVRWPALDGVEAEGLLLEPKKKALANVVALPDADWTPEMLAGLAPGVAEEKQYARRLAESQCRVLVPVLIDRKDTWSGNAKLGRMTNQPHREFIYRMAYEMGRHVIGYEVQKVLAAVDWFTREKDHAPVGVLGHGEGGLLALASAALDPRLKAAVVIGYFGPRESVWQEPIYRNVWASLSEFGDAEIGRLIAPRMLIVRTSKDAAIDGPPAPRPGRGGAAPGRILPVETEAAAREFRRLREGTYDKLTPAGQPSRCIFHDAEAYGFTDTGETFFDGLGSAARWERPGNVVTPEDQRKGFDPGPRQKRQLDQLIAFTQKLMRDSEARRQKFFWSRLDRSSSDKHRKSTDALRAHLWEEVIGKLPAPTRPMGPASRLIYDAAKWKGYEVTLDLYEDVFAYGILLVPNDIKTGAKRPVVVCQHGLEGRPQDVCNPKELTKYYKSFGAQLADRGYVVFAPQNPYIGRDAFRVLQRKANPLKLSLFSFIVRQHERALDWLASLPYVDAERIGFYGLSYGGKTALRVPALLPRYCLSICSGDFNEWIRKNVSVDFRGSYMFTGEYEMPEFDLGQTFNYAEMAALIAPRPFMVERGHNDGVGIDEMVAYEYAKVRRLYSELKLPQETTIEYFPGPHEINGKGTFRFLDEKLKQR